jgi:hypothetical protein
MSSPVPGSNGAASRRTRSVGTKLTEDEYARLESFAKQRGLTPGEWVREIVLAAFGRPSAGLIDSSSPPEGAAIHSPPHTPEFIGSTPRLSRISATLLFSVTATFINTLPL